MTVRSETRRHKNAIAERHLRCLAIRILLASSRFTTLFNFEYDEVKGRSDHDTRMIQLINLVMGQHLRGCGVASNNGDGPSIGDREPMLL